jgi:DNA polymerase-3 subunit epsilon
VTHSPHPQLGFAFLAELPTLDLDPPKSKQRASRPTVKDVKVPARQEAVPIDVESMAKALDAHVDYKVLRRLKPRLHWPDVEHGNVKTILVLDTETTGLEATKEKIIELALLRVDVDCATGMPVGRVQVYDELEDPGKLIPPAVTSITGIRDADVAGKKLDEARIAAFMEGVDLVVAHNAAFDRPFVESRLPDFARLPWACSLADIDWKALGRSSAKLESLAQAIGFFYDAHRAEMDCHALLSVLAMPLPLVSSDLAGASSGEADRELNIKGRNATGLSVLLDSAGKPTYRLSATNAPFEVKDLLKARGYRWNADQRVWATRLMDEAALQVECQWLRENVYANRNAVVQIESFDAISKFSGRVGKTLQQQL